MAERMCSECGRLITVGQKKRWKCTRCTHLASAPRRSCAQCGEIYIVMARGKTRAASRFCSRSCLSKHSAGMRAPGRRRKPPRSLIYVIDCVVCGAVVTVRNPRRRMCYCHTASEGVMAGYYRDKAEQGDGRTPERWRREVDRRHERLAHAYVEDVDYSEIAQRDGWRCALCGKKVRSTYQWPHPMSGSLDHTVPVSQGGEHSKANIRLAHLRCNMVKHDGGGGEQLMLIG